MNIVTLRIAAYLNSLFFIGLAVFATHAFGQIYHVKEMNTEQIKRSIERRRSCFFPEASLKSMARTCRRLRTVIEMSG